MEDRVIKSPLLSEFDILKAHEHYEYITTMDHVPNHGLWHLTLKESAELIAVDFFFTGEIKAEVPLAESYDPKDPVLREALSGSSKALEVRLSEAISNGSPDSVTLHT